MQANLATLENAQHPAAHNQRQPDPCGRAPRLPRPPCWPRPRRQPSGVGSPSPAPEPSAVRLSRLRQELAKRARRATPRSTRQWSGSRRRSPPRSGNLRQAGRRRVSRGRRSPSNPYALRLRETLGAIESEIEGPENRGAAPPRRHCQLPGPGREHPQARAGVPGAFAGLRDDEGSSTSRSASATRRRSSPRAWSSGRRASSSGSWIRRCPRGSRPRPTASGCSSMSLVLSLGLAGAALMLAEMLDTSFHSADELRAFTTIPVLVSMPTDRDRGRSAAPATALQAGGGGGDGGASADCRRLLLHRSRQ